MRCCVCRIAGKVIKGELKLQERAYGDDDVLLTESEDSCDEGQDDSQEAREETEEASFCESEVQATGRENNLPAF